MTEEFSQTEWVNTVKLLLARLCFKYSDLATVLGEDRYFVSHVFAGRWGITPERLITFKYVIPFLESVLARDGLFKKSVRESARIAAMRRKNYAIKLNREFKTYLDEAFKTENANAAKTIAE
jgi:hypothetical protein